VTDQAEEFRRTAAQCLALAQITTDLHTRAALTLIAQRLHDLATHRSPVDFDAMAQGFNEQQTTAGSDSEQPATQQQQQIQPKKEE
jgi:hypothetical protein